MQLKSFIAVEWGNLILMPDLLVIEMEKHKQLKFHDTEAGGIIIGKRRSDNLEAVNFTVPQRSDVRSRFRFDRREGGHNTVLEEQWILSNGEDNYLGEWHTHPEDHPIPSRTDLCTWKTMIREHGVTLLLIIIGRKSNYYALASKLGICQLTEIH